MHDFTKYVKDLNKKEYKSDVKINIEPLQDFDWISTPLLKQDIAIQI